MKYDFQICSIIWRLEQCFYHWFCRKCAEQKLHPLSYTDGDMDSQRQQDQHKSRYVPHIICDSGLGAKMSVLFACLIKRVSKLPLYQLVIILSSADVLCKQFGRPPVKYFTDRPKAVLLLWIFYVFFCLSFAMPLCTPVYVCFVCFCCFTSQVNSYGHCGTVSSLNHTFSWAGLNKRLTSNLCTYFRL